MSDSTPPRPSTLPPDQRPTAPPPSLEQLQSKHPPGSVYRTQRAARVLARTLGIDLD